MTAPITASMLYDLITCPHRVSMDMFGEPAEKGSYEVNAKDRQFQTLSQPNGR